MSADTKNSYGMPGRQLRVPGPDRMIDGMKLEL